MNGVSNNHIRVVALSQGTDLPRNLRSGGNTEHFKGFNVAR
jgi:hypothetical protein